MDNIMSNYIYYHSNDWMTNKPILRNNLGDLNITQAYIDNAKKIENNMLKGKDIPENFVSNVLSVLEMKKSKKEYKAASDIEKLFSDLASFVSTGLNQTILYGNTKIGQVAGGKELKFNADQLSILITNLQQIKNEIDKFDEGFQNLGVGEVSMISAIGMEKTAVAYKQLDSLIKKYKGGSIDDFESNYETLIKEIKQVCGSLVGDLKGGMLEWGDYIHSKVLMTIQNEVKNAVIQINQASLAGTDLTYIADESLQLKLGQSRFVSKSDNIINLTYSENGLSFTLDLGISDKSYLKSKGSGKSLADGISWQATMAEANLTDSAFEYYYANLLIHEKETITGSDELSAYLAAKASAFIISGVSGGDNTQAFFIRYGNKLVYIPNLLREVSKAKKRFAIKPTSKSIKNTFVETVADVETDSYARTRNTLNNLRRGVKFNATRT